MSCRRSVEKGHYKSEDHYIDIEEVKNGKKNRFSLLYMKMQLVSWK